MARSSRFGQLLAASLLLAGAVSALPTEVHMVEQREVAHAAPSPWVTVDASGKATTITPTATSINGAATTLSPPPDALTKTGTYTLAPTSAAVTTSTGLSPVATAASNNGDGAFLACTTYQGADAPFCQPRSGSQLNPGKTYYVTWSDTYFSNTSTSVQIQGTYHDGSGEGFTSPRMLASRGFFIWTIDSDFLSSRDNTPSSVNVTLTLAYFQDLYGNDVEEVPGPTVIVTSTGFEDDKGSSNDHKPNVVAIAVPIIIIIVFLALAGLCIWTWRRHGTVPVLGALKRRSVGGGGQGYGIRQSRSQRVGAVDPAAVVVGSDKKAGVGVELTDRDSWSPSTSPSGPGGQGAGRNVFREEMQRQERER
ncbi:hypothetical protein CONLIGDRAFT_718233 [Coniochaeta ligniaria NRRL 30616]|uniref:Mid2 domain-containing protein n=1 Tax=Coniochaeta ligniaria NRRL 30616 TaxID=1408157 RepID=A0A1J7IDA1_9PEZI|nr:hypothetical protein CONLIGDRAFT_718233 [Coniochaeta ligniaria NRRL 30616]